VRAYAQSAIKPRAGEREGTEGAGATLDAVSTSSDGEAGTQPPEKKVEIF
jgi:hypothetical protein